VIAARTDENAFDFLARRKETYAKTDRLQSVAGFGLDQNLGCGNTMPEKESSNHGGLGRAAGSGSARGQEIGHHETATEVHSIFATPSKRWAGRTILADGCTKDHKIEAHPYSP
jgi:hypothetical protein